MPLSHSDMKLDDPFYEDFLSRPTLHKYHIILHGLFKGFRILEDTVSCTGFVFVSVVKEIDIAISVII